jgi:hypothetical protein
VERLGQRKREHFDDLNTKYFFDPEEGVSFDVVVSEETAQKDLSSK